jgi:hypothetical protein
VIAPTLPALRAPADRNQRVPRTQATGTKLPRFPRWGFSAPIDFVVLDRGPVTTGADTTPVSENRATARGGGIQKWTFNGTSRTLARTPKTGLTTGVRHLLGMDTPSEVQLVATTTSTSNPFVRLVDTGGVLATTVVTAGTNTAFRGLTLSPVP